MTPEEAKALNEQLIRAYRLTFGSPSGQIVLNDLMKFCKFRIEANDQIEEGKRRVFLRILQMMNMTDDQLLALYGGQNLNMPAERQND